MVISINKDNKTLRNHTPTQVAEWIAKHANSPIITTNFRPNTAAILHIVTQVIPDIRVIWIDSGYNTNPTLEYAEKITELLKLNLRVYHPHDDEAIAHFRTQGIPHIDDVEHERFTKTVKFDPFSKAMAENNPDAWITGIRKDQTEFRQSLDVLSHSKKGILKVAPIFYWSEADQLAYIEKHRLPNETRYFDPTKAENNRECGLQLL